jgi:hypothetical protein
MGIQLRPQYQGTPITTYINGIEKMQATDSTYTSGNPGIGFNQNCGSNCRGASHEFGLTSFTATGSAPPPSPCHAGDSSCEGSTVIVHCFIATAAYGSYSHPDVKLLQDFRDKYLLTNAVGRIFINCYYKLSPAIASFITRSEILRTTTKVILKPVIYGIRYPYIFLLLLPAGIVVILWR